MYQTAVFSHEGWLHFGKTWTSRSQVTGMQVEIHGSAQYPYEVTPDDLIVLSKPMSLLIAWLRFGRGQQNTVLKDQSLSEHTDTVKTQDLVQISSTQPDSGGDVLCTLTGGSSAGTPAPRAPGSRPAFSNSHYILTYLMPNLLTLSQSI